MGSHYTFFTTTFLLMIYLGYISLLLLTVICYFFLDGGIVLQVCITMIDLTSPLLMDMLGTNSFAIINNTELNILICLCALVESVVKYTNGVVGGPLGMPVFKRSITKLSSKNAQSKLFPHQK